MAISDSTNEWNKLALEHAKMERERFQPGISAEEMRRRQEETYAANRIALDYAEKTRKN